MRKAQADGNLANVVARVVETIRFRSTGPALASGMVVTINFHPDRIVRGRMVVEWLAQDGIYRSQFETGISNGGLTAFPGGDRWQWESRMFSAAYDAFPSDARPKYGALNHRAWTVGAAPRFGSAHLRLETHLLERTTFCYPDSYLDPHDFGVAERMGVLSRFAEVEESLDLLDRYVEAHIHGPLDLRKDVEALVLDPSHRETDVARHAGALACPVEWHGGFRMAGERIPECAAYRGPEVEQAARMLVKQGELTPRDIGRAFAAGQVDSQVLKRLWHCIARFGFPDPI